MVLYCPKCKTSRECTRKGKNSKNEQLYFCKTCGKRFPEALGTLPPSAIDRKQESQYLEIIVDGKLLKKITAIEALEMIGEIFKNIFKDRIEITK